MENKKTEDWLPAGWTVEVRVRKNGKQDKCYFAPSSGLKFNSRVQVSRYLNNNHPVPEGKIKRLQKETPKEVIVKKVAAEGLPPGWIKEIKLRKQGCNFRRDSYYTDPVSGYVFRSMKEVSRYLESGEFGPHTLKPRKKGCSNVELEGDSSCVGAFAAQLSKSPAIAQKQKLDVDVTRIQITGDRAPKLCEIVKNEERDTLACMGERIPTSEHSSDQWVMELSSEFPEHKDLKQIVQGSDSTIVSTSAVPEGGLGTELKRSEVQENEDLRHIEQVSESATNMSPAGHEDIIPDMQSLETGMSGGKIKRTDASKRKSKKKIDTQLPRRASKRLAGVTLDSVPELKTPIRTRRVTVKLSDGVAAGAVQDSSTGHVACQKSLQCDQLKSDQKVRCTSPMCSGMSWDSDKSKHFAGKLDNSTERAGKLETKVKDDKKKGHFVVSPHRKLAIMEDYTMKVETEINTSDKPGENLNLPLSELWSDPCIAFAIKTLTGVDFNASASTEGSLGSNSSEVGADKKQVSTVLPLENLPVREELARKVEINDKYPEKPVSPHNLTFADVWTDPCIDFAIKTLTDAIPLDFGMVSRDSFSQQVGSSQTQESSGLTLPNVGKCCQTDLLCQQYAAVDKPSLEEQAFVEQVLPVTGNMNLQYADRTNRCQLDEVRRNEYRR